MIELMNIAAATGDPSLAMAYPPDDGFHHWRWQFGLGLLCLPFLLLAAWAVFRAGMAFIAGRIPIDPLP
ncbi:hypothetical protein IZ6_04110 [Terrihabitans soli]|uniref:Uncharacterized protein n=1 Tax=Terrihabitans soli TaxID=708113 RepID=A0A6S6QKA8_9HYPH|nr:hypothetical protein [Terrihabitans soli]BCJ89676.1 hypothetical protein IZ6_04110 [Terrihabitans soli]